MGATRGAEGSIAAARRFISLAVSTLALLLVLLIPLKIVSYGYLPYDDALRHSARAITGKPWSEILVLGNSYTISHNFGWELFLRQVHLALNLGTDWLVVFSIVLLFFLVGCAGLPWLKRPEAWLGSLLLAGLFLTPERLLFGRPFVFSIFALLTVLFVSDRFREKSPDWKTTAGLSLLIASDVFVHGTWYLWALPVVAFFLARQFHWGTSLGVAVVAGVTLAAILTGQPLVYLSEAIRIGLHSTGGIHSSLALELQPGQINPFAIILLAALWLTRKLARLTPRPLRQTPAFWLVGLGLVLELKVQRFWLDWGLPALMFLLAADLQLLFEKMLAENSFKRVGVTLVLAVTTYFRFTNDHDYRWTRNLINQNQYVDQANPEQNGWLPLAGGIFYTADMSLFYKTFYKNPQGNWRYVLGFEPTLMPEEDFKIFQKILTTYEWKDYELWVAKMKPEDRLFIPGGPTEQPEISELEWKQLRPPGVWSGRLPLTAKASASL